MNKIEQFYKDNKDKFYEISPIFEIDLNDDFKDHVIIKDIIQNNKINNDTMNIIHLYNIKI